MRDADSSASHPTHFPGEGHHQTQAVMFLPGQDPVSPLKWSLQSHIPLGFGCTTLPVGWGSYDKGPCWASGQLVIVNVPLSDKCFSP